MEDYDFESYDLFWVEKNINYLPEDIKKAFLQLHPKLCSISTIIWKTERTHLDKIKKIALQLYPELRNDGSIALQDFFIYMYIEVFRINTLYIYKLIEDQKSGKKVAEIYPNFSLWKNMDLENKLKREITEDPQPKNSTLSKQEWKKSRIIQIKKLNTYVKFWQKAYLKLFPEVINFQSDENFVFNLFILQSYEKFKRGFNYYQTLQDYGLSIPFGGMNEKELLKEIKTFDASKQQEVRRIQDLRLLEKK